MPFHDAILEAVKEEAQKEAEGESEDEAGQGKTLCEWSLPLPGRGGRGHYVAVDGAGRFIHGLHIRTANVYYQIYISKLR